MSSECAVESRASPDNWTDATGPETEMPADPDVAQTETAEAENREAVAVCQFFLMGKCRFGQKCRLSHSDTSGDQSQATLDNQDEKGGDEKKLKKKKAKAAKPKDYKEKEVNKKPRMRTADDVISRVLWDPSVEASEFVVGYVDRFLGVVERPFCEFNWEASPVDCDYTTELALPRHRIQYFTYRGHRVWDRHSRTDRVFGSTGQSLAPPFGGEEEVEDPRQEQDNAQTREDKTPAVCAQEEGETEGCACTENTHLEDERQNEMNIHTPDSALQSHGACVAEEAADSGMEEGALAEWDQSGVDPGDDALSNLASVHIGENPTASPEQAAERRNGRPPKKHPTHFVCFRANTPSVLGSFQQLEAELRTLLPASAPHWLPSSCLHVTLCLLVLPGPQEVAAAEEILQRFAHLDRNPPLALTFPVKLKHFNGRVLYLSPQPQNPLQQLNSGLQDAYRTEGLLHRNSFNPRYHLTLAKVPRDDPEKIFEGVEDLKAGKGLNFGRLPINTLYLCAMGGAGVDGFYEIVCSVNLR